MTVKKNLKKVKRTAQAKFQVRGTVSIDRLKEVLLKHDEVEFSVAAAHREQNLAPSLALRGRTSDEQR